jgi:AAA domain
MSTELDFEDASREQSLARIALDGPAGSGKTWTALTLATMLAGPDGTIGVIDTERRSASKYAPPFRFKTLPLSHYHPAELVKGLAKAEQHGIDVVCVDTLSKFWSGAGGMLEIVDQASPQYGGNQFGGWKVARPIEAEMLEALLAYPGHVIVTMRVKTAYEVTTGEDGKKKPVKIGLAPDQRQNIEYEFDIVGDLDLDNTLTISKTRCPELSGAVIRKPDEKLGKKILDWLTEGVKVTSPSDYRSIAEAPGISVPELKTLYGTVREAGMLPAQVLSLRFFPGRVMALADLITEAGQRAKTAQEAAAADAERQGRINEETEAQWVAEWLARLADARSPEAVDGLREDLAVAAHSLVIRKTTGDDLAGEATGREQELIAAAEAKPAAA